MITKRIFPITLAVALLIGLFYFWLDKEKLSEPIISVTPSETKPAKTSADTSAAPAGNAKPEHSGQMKPDMGPVKEMLEAFSAPIEFHGKVVDDDENPVPGANVEFSASDKPWKDGSTYKGSSDAGGGFSISGINGAALYVSVWKTGYYGIPDKSYSSFAYGVPPSAGVDRPIPTKDNPAIFILRKMGATEPLIPASRNIKTPKDGTPVEVDLRTGKPASTSQGDFKVECWTQDQNKDAERHYNWRCRVTVPGGGLVERKGQFDFEAPESGYKTFDEINMPSTADRWVPQVRKQYFLKLRDGKFARIEFEMVAGGDHFFVLKSYLNPTGSRNLEYDPAKEIKPGK